MINILSEDMISVNSYTQKENFQILLSYLLTLNHCHLAGSRRLAQYDIEIASGIKDNTDYDFNIEYCISYGIEGTELYKTIVSLLDPEFFEIEAFDKVSLSDEQQQYFDDTF